MYQETAPAKINLYLHVTGKRDDGYHLLDSLVIFTDVGDVLTYEPGSQPFSLKIDGPFSESLSNSSDDKDNLVLKAAREFYQSVGDPVVPQGQFVLTKRLPIASGIGGGSADAAAVLRLLHRCWHKRVPSAVMNDMAYRLGADVPVCYQSRSTQMRGIGERLTPVPPLPDCGIVLVNCRETIATPAIFKARRGDFVEEISLENAWSDYTSFLEFIDRQGNSLQQAACQICPMIETVIKAIAADSDCALARMSGSGATCFGLFETPQRAKDAALRLSQKYPQWWVWGGGLYRS